jgi:RecA-family ATPase
MPGPRQFTVEGLLPCNAPAVLYGDGGMAKPLLAMLIGDCVARGVDLFGRRVQRGRVLYLDWELDTEEQTRRSYRIAAGCGAAAAGEPGGGARADRRESHEWL